MGLEWEKPRLKVAVDKVKTIELRDARRLVEALGDRVALSIDHRGRGAAAEAFTVEVDFDEELGWYTGNVRVEGRALGARATLCAELGSRDGGVPASTSPSATTASPSCASNTPDEDPIAFRAYFDPPDPGLDGSQTLKILVRHAGTHQILGEDLSGQDSVEWLTLLPEIVCDTMVRRLMQRKHPISEEIDGPVALPRPRQVALAPAAEGPEARGRAGRRGPVSAATVGDGGARRHTGHCRAGDAARGAQPAAAAPGAARPAEARGSSRSGHHCGRRSGASSPGRARRSRAQPLNSVVDDLLALPVLAESDEAVAAPGWPQRGGRQQRQ